MNINDAVKKRIKELCDERDINITTLCYVSKITPSTLFDFMSGRNKNLNIFTIYRICNGINISIKRFFCKNYFENIDN